MLPMNMLDNDILNIAQEGSDIQAYLALRRTSVDGFTVMQVNVVCLLSTGLVTCPDGIPKK